MLPQVRMKNGGTALRLRFKGKSDESIILRQLFKFFKLLNQVFYYPEL